MLGRSSRHERSRRRSASPGTSSSTSTLSAFGGSSLTSDAPVPKDRRIDATDIPSTYVPGAQHGVPVAGARMGRGARRARPRHRRQRAGLFRISGLPSGIRRRLRAAWRRWPRPEGCRARRFRIHAPLQHLTKAEIIRRGIDAWSRLRPHPQLLRSRAETAGHAAAATAAPCAPPVLPRPA